MADNALVVRPADGATSLAPAGPTEPVRRAVPAMLEVAVQSFGDVVRALLSDLETASHTVERLGWLSVTQGLLHDETSYRAALEQLRWWDSFLASLPCPQLGSDLRQPEIRRLQAERLRARLVARDRYRLQLEAQARDEDEIDAMVRACPDPPEAELPAIPAVVPIVAADLDPLQHMSGFTAVRLMREHPLLGPRALHMDQALAAVLVAEFGVRKKDAPAHAQALTGIFWIALRRALSAGSHRLATSVALLSHAGEDPVRDQFTRELLESWLAYLRDLPVPDQRSFWQRLLGRPAQPKQLTSGE